MKTKQLFSTMLFAAAMIASSLSFGQVKVGTNPATIGANSNLEVEGANGKKVIVHKDNGTVVIENTPSGALTDSIMTIDNNGNVKEISRTSLIAPVAKRPFLRLGGSFAATTSGANVIATNLSAQLQNSITYTPGNGQIRINESGIYFYSVSVLGPNRPDAPAPGVYDFCHYVLVNGASIEGTCSRSPGGQGTGSTNSGI